MEIEIKNQEQMAEIAKKIALISKKFDIIGLKGSLGVGKSFFARNFINAIAIKKENIASPTFNLVYPYKIKNGQLFHFDLYRVKNFSELENIGFFDLVKEGICVIEWPEIVADYLKERYLEITIESSDDSMDEQRTLIINCDQYWQNKLSLIF